MSSIDNRILVTYATRAGSTAEVAEAIAETLRARGFSVDVNPVKQNPQVDSYQAVVVGSAIRFAQWLPEAVAFVKNNQAQLRQLPTAFFTVHILNTGTDEPSINARSAYLDSVHTLVKSDVEAFFTGEIDFNKLSLFERTMARLTKSPVGDLRDWQAIRDWAQTILT